MLEFLVFVTVIGLLAVSKHQQLRFIYAHIKRSFTFRRPVHRPGPYRYNPEAERDYERERAKAALQELERVEAELVTVRMERDLARQRTALNTYNQRARYGGAVALGALVSFTSFNVLPQMAHDLNTVSEVRPHAPNRTVDRRAEHMRSLATMALIYRAQPCTALMCCHDRRPRLVAFGELILRIDPIESSIRLHWLTWPGVDSFFPTSGGENPAPLPQDPQPVMIEHAEPGVDETEQAIAALIVSLD